MKKNLLLGFSILVCLLLQTQFVKATHIMGGSLSYTYLGIDSITGNFRYKITIDLFRLCDPGSTNLPIDMNLGVYEDDPANPNGDKILVFNTVIPLVLQQAVTPPNGNDTCTFAPSVCVEEGVYEDIILVPPSANGYYFISDRCCRNNNILNLDNPGNAGQAYFAFAPPPLVVNSSPVFAAAPVPFICNTDTVSILNQAFDPDGDLLTYSFVTPYTGVSDGGNPNPNPPATYPWTIPTVNYAPTYSVTNPFGAAGYANMNSSTGLASYYAPNQGFYALAVEIQEFRNGVLIGVSRRDIQIIVITCPANPAPNLSPVTNQVNWTIAEGDSLCFNAMFLDPNNDSLFITHTGDIFDSLLINPPATFTDASGLGTATGQFCWFTTCDLGSAVPYQFSVTAIDKGCPAKTTNVVYTITVENTPAPLSMTGPDTLCGSATGLIYAVPLVAGYTYNWTVTNGTIVGSSTGNSITVNFSGTGTATVSASMVNVNGCLSSPLIKTVILNAIPVANAGSPVSLCSGNSATLGTGTTAGYSYSWTPTTGLSSDTISNPTVTLINAGSIPVTTTYIVTVTQNGCVNSDTVTVTVNPGAAKAAGPDKTLCSGNTTFIGLPPVAGNTYVWSPSTGLSSTTIANPTVTLSGATQTFQYIVTTTNSFGCATADTVDVTLNETPVANAGVNISFCSGGSGTIGTAPTAGYTYFWTPITGLSSPTASNPTVTLTNTTGSPITYTYIVVASLAGCTNTDTVTVRVNAGPISNAGTNQLLCAGGTVNLGTTATTGYTYLWSPATGLSSDTISNPTLTLSNVGSTPDTLLYIVTTTLNTCQSTDTVQIISSPAPIANAGTDVVYCSGSSAVIGTGSQTNYVYSWTPSTGLSSSTASNPTVTLVNTSGIPDTINYIVTTNLFGCLATDTVQVIVNPSPVSNAGSNQFLCAGGTVNLGTTSTAGYSYSWSPATGLNSTTISNPVLTLNNTGATPDTLFYVVTTTLGNCTTTDTVQVVSSPVPTANAGTDVVYCSGSTAVIGSGSQANYTYSWTPATGLSSGTASNPTVTLINTTGIPDTINYIVTTNLFGCVDADTVQVIVNPNPVSEAGNNTTLCGGDTLVIGTATTAGYTYSWAPPTGLSSTTISNPVAIFNNQSGNPTSITYAVTTTLNGCTTTDSITITINPQPVVTASATPSSLCFGDSTTLSASGATNYSWALSTSPTNPISTSSSFVVSPGGTTTYILTGTNGSGCTNTNTITVTVNPLPIVQILSNDSLCAGDTLLLTATGATNYTWSISGGGTIGTGSTISVNPTVNTTYIVTGTNSALCADVDSISVVISPAATLNAITGTTSVCPGVTGVQYWVVNSNGNSSYSWTITNGTIVSGQGTDTVTVDWSAISGPASITCTEATDLGCLSSPVTLTININVFLTPVAPTGPTVFCANTALGIIYTALSTPSSTYNWFAQGGTIVSGNGTNTVTVDWTTPGPATVLLWYQETSITSVDTCFGSSDTLTVTLNPAPNTGNITGPNGICVTDTGSFSVVNTASSTYNWTISGGNILNGNGSNTITANWTGSGTATVSVVETNSFGCIGSAVSFPVTVNGLPAANAGSDVSVCIGQGVYLNASGGVGYVWTPAATLDNPNSNSPFATPFIATEYIVLVTDINGCNNTDSVIVNVNALPVITLTANSSVCIGNSIQLNANGGNGYQWSPASSLDSDTIANPVATPTGTTTYTVIVTDQNTCVDSAFVTISVNALPTALATGDTLICAGASANLLASGGVSYQWSPSSTLNNSSIFNPVASPLSNTTYVVTVTDGNGCSDDTSITVFVNVNPEASFTVQDGDLSLVTCKGYEGALQNTSINALNYIWIFPDGSTSTDINPQVQFNLSGNNEITLIAINNSCYDTVKIDFASTILGQVFSDVPNIITPNGDGKNDCFEIGNNIDLKECSQYYVYNRWGNEVFKSSSSQPCWNGKKDGNGKDLPDGTYYIIIKVSDKSYNGIITLIR